LGKKPLYYALQRDILIFSSQINFIKKILKKTSLSFTAISNYLALGYLIDPMTMYNEIISVEPGEIIEIDLSDLQIKYKSKFTPDAINYSYGMDIKSTLNEAISERVRGHSRFALSLSGGIDSTILLLQSLNLGYRAEPFTVCWPHADKSKYNLDAKIALQITKKLGIDLNVVEMPDNKYLPALILDYSKAMEEPNSNPSGISMMELYSRIAQSGLRLVLTGDGADEVFGGYHRYTLTKRMELLPKIQSQVLNKIMLGRYPWTKNLSKVTKAFTSDTNQESWLFWHLNAGSYSIKSLCEFLPEFSLNISDGGFSNLFNYSKSSTAETMFKDLNTWIPMESNRKLDRISMWHSVEARSPFQSEKVINTGYTTMDRFRFKYTNKEILRDTYPEISDLIPNQKKMGFISPLGDWLRSNPELIMHSLQILKLTLPLNERELNSLIKSPSEGDFNRFKLLWSLVILGQWIEVNL
jgi:asparagine synthase (glutamine-hydrolysing)